MRDITIGIFIGSACRSFVLFLSPIIIPGYRFDHIWQGLMSVVFFISAILIAYFWKQR